MTARGFTAEERLRAVSHEAREKRRRSIALRAAIRREAVIQLHRQGLVDGAIARRLGLKEATVARWLSGHRVRPKYGRGFIG